MQPYDDALQFIMKNGIKKSNRTSVEAISVFGLQTRYDISKNFPILTKRKMFYNSIFKELLWIVSGSTNINDLEAMGSKIWTPWRDKNFEQRNEYGDGELGPIYGWQLRHFNAPYENRLFMMEEDWIGLDLGFDQLAYIVNELKTNPNSRRILFTYWNPKQVTSDIVKLPPCHHTFQLSCNDGILSGMLFQRSADYVLGVPANVQFYSALIYMLCQQCGDLTPGELIHSTADSHIYVNQVSMVEEYLARSEVESPSLKLTKACDIFHYKPEDFVVENYNPLDRIEIPIAL